MTCPCATGNAYVGNAPSTTDGNVGFTGIDVAALGNDPSTDYALT